MIRRKFLLLGVILAGIAIAGVAPPAHATFQLTVQEFTSVGMAEGSALTFNGSEPGSSLGTIFGASGSTASFAFSFSASQNSATFKVPNLHLDTFSIGTSTSTTNYLVVAVTEGGSGHGWAGPLGGPLISNLSSIYGIGSVTVTLQSFGDADNNAFGIPTGTMVPAPPGGSNAFSPPLMDSAVAVAAPTITMNSSNNESGITTSSSFGPTGRFSLTQVVTVTGLEQDQTISFNSTTTVTPAPPGWILALTGGLPFAGLYYLRRRVQLTRA